MTTHKFKIGDIIQHKEHYRSRSAGEELIYIILNQDDVSVTVHPILNVGHPRIEEIYQHNMFFFKKLNVD